MNGLLPVQEDRTDPGVAPRGLPGTESISAYWMYAALLVLHRHYVVSPAFLLIVPLAASWWLISTLQS
ncbi:MAG: hypothetical protein KKA32_17015 [Actinobacteria bacterium]|nr:hypothetical protein [Actinomycetota bacterium]